MTILNESPQIGDGAMQRVRLTELLRDIAYQVNALSRGSFGALEGAATAAPTTGTWAQGDFIANSNRVEAGAPTEKYVLMGWVCVAGGTPGTWVESRTLTGN